MRDQTGNARTRPVHDPLERVIRPIVDGQVRSFINDHPQFLEAVDWYKPRADRAQTLVNSIAKRILRDLLCAETRVRLIAVLVECMTADAADDGPDMGIGAVEGGGDIACAPALPSVGLSIPARETVL